MLDADRSVGQYFAINLRKIRTERGLSQADLAQRVKELGHSCTQATIWKLEQGHREPKLTEAVAIGKALNLWNWTELTSEPATFNAATAVDHWRLRVHELAEQTRIAAAAQMEALMHLAVAVRTALDAGLPVKWAEGRSGSWLELTPEATVLRAVLVARAVDQLEAEEDDRRLAEEERLMAQIVGALESSGVPLTIKPEDIRFVGPDSSHDEDGEATG